MIDGTNVLAGATNVMADGTNVLMNGTNVVAGATNVVSSIVTNFVSGSGNSYSNAVPAGGATVINGGRITTLGSNSHGIFAESLPGSINPLRLGFTGNQSIVWRCGAGYSVQQRRYHNSGDTSHGILAQSLGGLGPEDSPTSGNGSQVTVETAGGTIITSGNGSYGIYAQSIGGGNIGGESGGAAGDGDDGGAGGDGGPVTVTGTGVIATTNDNAGGIFALSQAGNGGNGGNGGTLEVQWWQRWTRRQRKQRGREWELDDQYLWHECQRYHSSKPGRDWRQRRRRFALHRSGRWQRRWHR